MKKKLFIVLAVVLAFASAVSADFRADEDPTWVIFADTAYTLRGGEWNIDLTGAVSYGIIDGLHVWTHLILWAFQIPNLQAKWNIIPDSGSMPAISIGGTIGNATYKEGDSSIGVLIWNLSAYLSKKLGDNIWLSGSYTYNRFNMTFTGPEGTTDLEEQLSTWTGSSDPTGMSNASLSFVYQMSPGARICIESVAAISENVSFSVNPGVTWAMGDSFRLKLFVMTALGAGTYYVPCVNLAWKIK